MPHPLWLFSSVSLLLIPACGSDDGGGGAAGTGGSGGNQATTCADGYPKLGAPCAIAFEKCASCGTYACCDVFECQSGAWAQTQFHTACPSDGGSDASDAGSDVESDSEPGDSSISDGAAADADDASTE
ncbi:MAG: hypothetical protein IPI67_34370 [Myxococcales bacterium]|nr:hypothetical protein [Myxococcales bacterium]